MIMYSNGIHNWKGDKYEPAKTNPFGKQMDSTICGR